MLDVASSAYVSVLIENDSETNSRVKCLTVTNYQQIGNTATWEGTAEVNGVREHYRITVQDNGEPNQGIDAARRRDRNPSARVPAPEGVAAAADPSPSARGCVPSS